jgi:hypothetical protein
MATAADEVISRLAVLDVDARVVDDKHRAGGALQHDAAGGTGEVRYGEPFQGSGGDGGDGRLGVARARRYFGGTSPKAADPDGIVGIALLELDPDAGADDGQGEHAVLDSAIGTQGIAQLTGMMGDIRL